MNDLNSCKLEENYLYKSPQKIYKSPVASSRIELTHSHMAVDDLLNRRGMFSNGCNDIPTSELSNLSYISVDESFDETEVNEGWQNGAEAPSVARKQDTDSENIISSRKRSLSGDSSICESTAIVNSKSLITGSFSQPAYLSTQQSSERGTTWCEDYTSKVNDRIPRISSGVASTHIKSINKRRKL